MLVHFGINPYLVFDGDYLPSKSGTEKERAARRKESRKNGLELLRLGKTSQAQLELQKSIDVTPEMACQLIEELKKAKIDYVVAPYEADAQMVYLEQRRLVHAIISEDSDLLVFGAQCLLTKLDQYGDCVMIERKDFTACRDISLVGWTDAEFRLMAILSGCDYLSSIDKMGLKTAYRLIRKHKTVDRIVRVVQFDGKMKVPPGYLHAFRAAEATFLYQWVYCTQRRCLVNFSEPASDVNLDAFPCIGSFVRPDLAIGVATGQLHPHTKQPIVLPPGSTTTSRPPLRQSISINTPELKKNKSIESFFKRTPLAELDPNTFTPSPSQRQLLDRSPASWSAEPIIRRPFAVRHSPLAPSSAPHRVSRAVTDMGPPSNQSPKRQRLCSDGLYATPIAKDGRIETGASKFFASKSSPSLSRKNSDKKAANEFNLWSDDSVEEAMSQLPDHHSPPTTKSSRKLAVFKDGVAKATDITEIAFAVSSSTPVVKTTALSERHVKEPPSPAGESVFTAGLAANAQLLRFTYSSSKEGKQSADPVKRSEDSRPDATKVMPSNEGRSISPSVSVPCSSPARDRQSPEESGIHRSSLGDDLNEADWQAAESRPLHTLPVTRPSAAQRPMADEITLKGSEDLLVPDSEGEGEEETSRHTGFSFDLGRFAFAG